MSRISVSTPFWAVVRPFAIVFFAMPLLGPQTRAADVTRVEEDWELVVGEPSPNGVAPQVLCVMAPQGNVELLYSTFTVNHNDVPEFTPGGMQLEAWNGTTLLDEKRLANQAVLATPEETIRWTNVMRLSPEGLVFEVRNGESTTWGSFGSEGQLKTTVATSLANLNGYSPQVSVGHSGVIYAANRVRLLALKHIRVYDAAGLVGEDDVPRIVHALED